MGGRKEIVISEEPVHGDLKTQVHAAALPCAKANTLSLGLESGTTTSSTTAVCFLALLALHCELQKVLFSFLVGKKHNFEPKIFCTVDFYSC